LLPYFARVELILGDSPKKRQGCQWGERGARFISRGDESAISMKGNWEYIQQESYRTQFTRLVDK